MSKTYLDKTILDYFKSEDQKLRNAGMSWAKASYVKNIATAILGEEICDVFSHGDLGLRRGLEKLYNLDNPSKKQIESIVSKWIPYRTFGSIALWQSLEK